ncbi:undecaprenyl-phosphate glucose phosphotransferase [Castellaniella caeni]|uniref:undecaprenyl-phosphate glucose phosphotransferase n=1 Tax=Castellaniella caeni TaxID=266123 RepID=UPI00082EA06D|nr:undecaprenyl-phosphate glucose phosphotransferase [Castellaniella caeni]
MPAGSASLQFERLGRHNRSFLILAGLLSGVLNGGVCWWLMRSHGLYDPLYRTAISLLLGGIACSTFYHFRLMISARNLTWMLSQASVRWLRILMVTLLLFFLFLYDETGPATIRLILLQWIAIVFPAQCALLAVLRLLVRCVNYSPANRRKAVFIGLGPEAAKLARRLLRSRILGIEPVGYYANAPLSFHPDDTLNQLRYLGSYKEALHTPDIHQNHLAFLAMTEKADSQDLHVLTEHLYDSTSDIYYIPEPNVSEGFAVYSVDIAGVPLLALHETSLLGLPGFLKRGMDIVLVSLALALLWPVMLLVALAIKLDSPGPILYSQERYGRYGLPIKVYKFRSMRTDAAQNGVLQQASRDDHRVTRVGYYLRRFSLDELPQLFNVLQGSMSLVGPRPHATSHNELYRHQIRGYMLRHTVKPGITGWAQVNGLRGETDTLEKMERRVEFDRYYITCWSLWLDMKILFKTVLIVLWDKNAY